ncbi:MAG: trehalose-6-phosphate synthase [Acidimicrobiia bacterium]|nr:trehalose-6-phosphate synthase [Acidimicrobiia bacterium]
MIIVSHRGPFSFRRIGDSFEARRGAGGVVSALGPLLLGDDAPGRLSDEPVRWVAAAIGDDDRAAVEAGAADVDEVDLHLLALDPAQHRAHYEVISNATLWFVLHGMYDLVRRPRFDDRFFEAWEAYVAVNAAFAASVVEFASPGETVLVQDYQLFLVPGMLRDARPDLAITFFCHTPFCGPNSMRVLPDAVATAICSSVAAVPTGFHTQRWARAFEAGVHEILGEDTTATTFVAPLGPDRSALADVLDSDRAVEADGALDALVKDRAVIVRSDRIEPSKNIVRGFLAYDLLLEKFPRWRGSVVFVAMLYGSREGLPEYLAYRSEVEQAVENVNRRWRTDSWDPVLLFTDDDFPRSLAGLARADVLFINPIRDGLNLVAKEGPVINRHDAVLCLSPEAGAWAELGGAAVAVHPYDLVQAASALDEALAMDPAERRHRADDLRRLATARTPADWLTDQLDAAR